MKERILDTFEVARQTTSTPRMVDANLTSLPQNPHTRGGPRFNRGGESFMEGKTDMTSQQPERPQIKVSATGRSPAENREIGAEREMQRLLREKGYLHPVAGGQNEPPEEPEEQSLDPYINGLRNLFKIDKVRKELGKNNPNLNEQNIPELRDFINRYIDPTSPDDRFIRFSDIVTDRNDAERRIEIPVGRDQRGRIVTEEIVVPQISDEARKILFEWLLERIISIPDLSPESPYLQQLNSIYVSSNLSQLLSISRSRFNPEEARYFGELVHIREVAHELNRSLSFGEQYKSYVTEHLRTGGLDFMQNELAGVNIVLRLYEKIAANKVKQNKLWFTQEGGQMEQVDREVETIFNELVKIELAQKDNRPLTEWEKQRALRIARIFFAGTQRMSVYASLGDLPPEAMASGRYGSVPYEFIARAIYPFKMTAPRFFGNPGPKKFMEMTFEEQDKANPGEFINLFGLEKQTIIMDGYGAQDTESHSWRSNMLFYKNIKLAQEGQEKTLLDYFNEAGEKVAQKGNERRGQEWNKAIGTYHVFGKEDREKFSEIVKDKILGQRLYLSVLTRYGNFDTGIKTSLWEKITMLKPSTIASLLPDTVIDKDKDTWESLRHKLYIAEEKRVAADTLLYRKEGGLTETDLSTEKQLFEKALVIAKKPGEWTEEDYTYMRSYMYMRDLELEPKEKKVLENLIKNGVRRAGDLAKAKIPFTFVIDDAPVITWTSDENLIRILLSDQDAYTKGWNEINTLVEYPATGAVEHFSKAVEFIQTIVGRSGAQDVIEPFMIAYLNLAATKQGTLWMPGAKSLSKLSSTPTSEIEKYYRNTFLSLDERERADLLLALSQAKAIRDDLVDVVDVKEGITQLDSIRKKTKSGRIAMSFYWIRIIVMLFGPVAGYEFLKTVLPADLLK